MVKKSKVHLFDSKEVKLLWKKSDDAIRTSRSLKEIYKKVPKEVANVQVSVLEFHVFETDEETKKLIDLWLNN